ncbi:hypothetical protein ACIBQX_14295 [Nonomuraea sp. NPDC049714]
MAAAHVADLLGRLRAILADRIATMCTLLLNGLEKRTDGSVPVVVTRE